VIVVAVRW
jgi:transposase, IS6 family